MFTGIIQGIAKIISIKEKRDFCIYTIELPNHMIDGLKIGNSIANNGCCLSITTINYNCISFDVIKETLNSTNLGQLKPTDMINVERSAKFGDEIGGHLMSGHIMTTAEVTKISTSDNNYQIWFKLKKTNLIKYILHKGFIGIDGISLTVGEVISTNFCVYVIPETLKRSTLGMRKLGQLVNIEIDFQTQTIVDTVERIMASKTFK